MKRLFLGALIASLHAAPVLAAMAELKREQDREIAKALEAPLVAPSVLTDRDPSLFRSVQNNDIDTVANELARLDADAINGMLTAEGKTLLYIAAENGHTELVAMLLKQGAHPDATVKGMKRYPLHIAAQNGHTEIVRLLITHGAQVNPIELGFGVTPLYLAARHNRLTVAELLLRKGAHVDAPRNGGITPLRVASERHYVEMIKILLAHGANPNAGGDDGGTPLSQAVMYSPDDSGTAAITLLLDAGALVDTPSAISPQETPLMFAARKNNQAVVQLLLARGANKEAEDMSGNTPLMYAIMGKAEQSIVLLLDHGADINHVSKTTGQSALGKAHACNPDVIGLLEQRGARLEEQEINVADLADICLKQAKDLRALREHREKCVAAGQKLPPLPNWEELATKIETHPFLDVIAANSPEALQIYIEEGLNPNARIAGLDGFNPTAYALQEGNLQMAELLVAAGANIDQRNDYGKTFLQLVVEQGVFDLIPVLLQLGADVNQEINGHGGTLIHLAAGIEDQDFCIGLLTMGAKNTPDDDGLTPADIARKVGNNELAELIETYKPNVETEGATTSTL